MEHVAELPPFFRSPEIHGNGHQKGVFHYLDECVGLIPSTEDHTEADWRTLVDFTFLIEMLRVPVLGN